MTHHKRPHARFSRRALLQGIGAGAALSPFVPLLQANAEDGPPLRLVVLFSANGTIRENWLPEGGVNDFSFGPILAPLESVKNEVTVIDGLRFLPGGAGNRHMQGPSKFASGAGLFDGDMGGGGNASGGWGRGTSIDQAYAAHIKGQTPFSSLELGVRVTGSNVRHRLSYAGPDEPIPPESDPSQVFERLFAEAGQDVAELARLRAERRSVLDTVVAQTQALNARIGVEDRHKLDAHLEGLSEIERRLGGVGKGCEVPELEGVEDHLSTQHYPAVTRLQMDLLAAALACDLTRASTFMWNGSTSPQTFPWLDISESHHDLSHEGDSNGGAKQKLTEINTWYAEQVAYFVEALAAIPEGDGTLLDNTIVLWGNELGKGNNHSHDNVPFILAGGRNAGLNPGRFLQFDDLGHNRLLVSVLNALGMSVDSYGDLDDDMGPLSGL